MDTPNIPLLIKDGTKGFVGRYRIIKARLERPEHFQLDAEIRQKRDELNAIQGQIDAIQPASGVLAFIVGISRQKRCNALLKRKKTVSEEMVGQIRQLNRICKTEVAYYSNIVPTVGRTMIANNLTDATPTNDMLINYAETGTGTNTPANGDTALQTPVFRNTIASITNSSNIAYATMFIAAADDADTYREAGIYCDGTASLGTGILLSRVAINVTKSLTETLTIDWELTIS